MNISENLNLESKIQRYMDLPKFLHLLETSKLFLSKISAFDDNLEGGLTRLDALLISGVAERLDFAINRLWPSTRKMSPEEYAGYKTDNEKIQRDMLWFCRCERIVIPDKFAIVV